MESVQNRIKIWAESLTKRVIEIRNFDTEEMTKSISAHINIAIHDCIKIQITDTERKLNQKKLIYSTIKGQPTEHIQKEIIELNAELKQYNKTRSEIEQIEKLIQLINHMKEHHPESLKNFYNQFEKHLTEFSSFNKSSI